MEWLAEHFQEQYGIATKFESDSQACSLPDDVKIILFKSVRELLFNVAKHAHARCVTLSIRKDDTRVRISVEDDGVGFDARHVGPLLNENGGFGLFSIRERLNHLGGHLQIESEPGAGARMTLVAPLRCLIKRKKRNENENSHC